MFSRYISRIFIILGYSLRSVIHNASTTTIIHFRLFCSNYPYIWSIPNFSKVKDLDVGGSSWGNNFYIIGNVPHNLKKYGLLAYYRGNKIILNGRVLSCWEWTGSSNTIYNWLKFFMWVNRCALRCPFRLDLWGQWGHWNCRSFPHSNLRWLMRVGRWRYSFPQLQRNPEGQKRGAWYKRISGPEVAC